MKRNLLTIFSVLVIVGGLPLGYYIKSHDIKQNDSKTTAAEAQALVQIDEISQEPATSNIKPSRELATPIDYNQADKNDILHMMLNSIDYYDSVSGTMIFSSDNKNVVNVVDFQSELSTASAYSRYEQYYIDDSDNISLEYILSSECTFSNLVFCNQNSEISIFPNDKTYIYQNDFITRLDEAVPIKDDERVSFADDGYPVYRYRANPTNVTMSSMCIFPQEIAMGYLNDTSLWEVSDIVNYNELICFQIKGVPNNDYGAKLNVSQFEFLVDVNTGALVKYQGYDKDGNLSDFMYTENLKFDDKADSVTPFSDNLISQYSQIQ